MTSDNDIETFIRESFEQNFERLKLESGHSLTADVKEAAFHQVLLYWQKLQGIAEQITETEVHLNLPNQQTPQGRKYGLEGVVDIVRGAEETVMYDIKTHDAETVQNSIEDYAKQLNIYAHIWQILREQPLDKTAIIATAFPDALRKAMSSNDDRKIELEMALWNPVVEIPFNANQVYTAIEGFGKVVDEIEEGCFKPASLQKLKERSGSRHLTFGIQVCRNCDARFSCESYLQYSKGSSGKAEKSILQYLYEEDQDMEDQNRLTILFDTSQTIED